MRELRGEEAVIMTLEEMDRAAADEMGKAACGYWAEHILRATWERKPPWERELWIGLVRAGEKAYVSTYGRLLEEAETAAREKGDDSDPGRSAGLP